VTTGVALKIFGVAFAVGLDVLALSIAVGIMQIPLASRVRLGLAFSASEVLMQGVGYFIGTGAGVIIGVVSTYVGFAVLAGVGMYIIYESFQADHSSFKADSALGFFALCVSISLDSLGIGASLPGVPLPLAPLLATVAVSTLIFTGIGLAFGSRLGARYQSLAQRAAGAVLIVLAGYFTVQHVLGWGA
jgi:putative Mn2+ efflux pump MntP